ncbi:MAG: phosphoadenosine phosphosulfate reductase family protein [Selenomonadaceae bacterium]|nr:phosphoadenosine phosphosulfate reductase family protein [Selenomonadaceae bacterium]
MKWKHLLNAPFEVSHKCCTYMKQRPLYRYHKETGRKPIMGIMASESHRRKMAWIRTGCNAYDAKQPNCKPLSFWTDHDVLQYVLENHLHIPEVYGDIVEKNGRLQTTGVKRTGCMYCLIACHLEKPNKFQRMKVTHPKIYRYCMEELGMEKILTYLGMEH